MLCAHTALDAATGLSALGAVGTRVRHARVPLPADGSLPLEHATPQTPRTTLVTHESHAWPHTHAAKQVIGDHTRAVAYLLSDGVTPSNTGRGYIVRRLLRRVVMKVSLAGQDRRRGHG